VRIRVLHVIQNLNYGGMERLFADIVRLLDPAQFESHVMVMDYLGRFGEGIDRYATVHHAVRMPKWSMLHPGPLIEQLRLINPDVIHTHSGVWFKVSLAARRAGIKWIIHTEHGRQFPDPWIDRVLGRLASRRTNVIVAVSDALGDHLRTKVVADPARVRVIRNGVDTDVYRARADTGVLRKELGIQFDTPVLGSIGRLEPIKGYDIMIEAFAILLQRWKGGTVPVLVVAGEGSERGRLDQMVEAHGLKGSIFLLGWRKDVEHLHSAFVAFTMSSRSEGTSVSLLEAMSTGLCPIVTDVGGNRAVLGPELAHRLVPPSKPEALAGTYESILADGATRSRDGQAARHRVMNHFGLEAMVAGYADLYRYSARP
jgi:glycosyltransferase involved in cell wall biosynthesis